MNYIWENKEWPNFCYNNDIVSCNLDALNSKIGDIDKLFDVLDEVSKSEICHSSLTAESISSSKIEGITLHAYTVANSLAEKLGTSFKNDSKTDDYSKNVAEVIWDAVTNTNEEITFERLFAWQTLLVKDEPKINKVVTIGAFRNGSVGVYSGCIGKENLEYIAPPAENIVQEMTRFVNWVNESNVESSIVKSAICSLWFVSIHPFDDGNGRLSRALADYIISKGRKYHYFSVSQVIEKNKSQYYEQLGLVTEQCESIDITDWICWYIGVIKNAVQNAFITFIRTIRLTRIIVINHDL